MYLVNSPAEEGAYAAQIAGYSFGPDTLTQTIATTAGQDYTLSFWIYQQAIGPLTFFSVTWDGSTVVSMSYPASDSGDIPYVNFTASVVGMGSDTLQFISANDPGWTYVDNVSLGVVPEPSTWAMMMLGFAGLGFAGYRKTKRGERVLSVA
jgi:PEP-CTERM motif